MEKVTLEDGQSADIVAGNIEKLMELFPDAIKEGAVDFEVLRQLLGDASVLNEDDEKYGLSWHGKKAARQIALTPSTGTLLPREDQSVDWDTTQNLAIAGDNLEALKLLQKPYANKIKVIYIDPSLPSRKRMAGSIQRLLQGSSSRKWCPQEAHERKGLRLSKRCECISKASVFGRA